jgi:hypothetical protein
MSLAEETRSKRYIRAIVRYLALVVPPVVVAHLIGNRLSVLHYAVYCAYVLPMEAVRRLVFTESLSPTWKWVILGLYSLGLSVVLVWAVTTH